MAASGKERPGNTSSSIADIGAKGLALMGQVATRQDLPSITTINGSNWNSGALPRGCVGLLTSLLTASCGTQRNRAVADGRGPSEWSAQRRWLPLATVRCPGVGGRSSPPSDTEQVFD